LHNHVARGGSTILVVGGPAMRARAFMEAVALSPRHKPSLFFSAYPGFTDLLFKASRELGVEDLLDLVLISTVAAEAPMLSSLVDSLSLAMREGRVSVVGFNDLFTPALRRAGGDIDEKARLTSALSMLRALAHRGGVRVLIMEATTPPCLITRRVDATWPQASLTSLGP